MRRAKLYMYGSVFLLKAKQHGVRFGGWLCRRRLSYLRVAKPTL